MLLGEWQKKESLTRKTIYINIEIWNQVITRLYWLGGDPVAFSARSGFVQLHYSIRLFLGFAGRVFVCVDR